MTVKDFEAIVAKTPYVARGMFFSELFLFLTMCQASGVDLIIESGVRNGNSTRVIAASGIAPLIAIDFKYFDVGPLPGVRFIAGDGRQIVPRLLDESEGKRVGVLLDGPKGPKGRALKDFCLTRACARVVACHDSLPGFGESAHSHDRAWRESYRYLDDGIPAEMHAFRPNGPGLGVWVQS